MKELIFTGPIRDDENERNVWKCNSPRYQIIQSDNYDKDKFWIEVARFNRYESYDGHEEESWDATIEEAIETCKKDYQQITNLK